MDKEKQNHSTLQSNDKTRAKHGFVQALIRPFQNLLWFLFAVLVFPFRPVRRNG